MYVIRNLALPLAESVSPQVGVHYLRASFGTRNRVETPGGIAGCRSCRFAGVKALIGRHNLLRSLYAARRAVALPARKAGAACHSASASANDEHPANAALCVVNQTRNTAKNYYPSLTGESAYARLQQQQQFPSSKSNGRRNSCLN